MKSKWIAWCSVVVYFIILLSTTGCGEDRLSYKKTQPLGSESVVAAASKIRSRAIGAWSTPQRLATEIISNASANRFHGPELESDYKGSAFATWRLHTNFNPQTGLFQGGRTAVLRKEPGTQWRSASPIPQDRQSTSTLPQILLNKNSGHGIALWTDNGEVFTSHFDPNIGWGLLTSFGAGDQGWLSINSTGVISALWVSSSNTSQFSISARQYVSGSGWTAASNIVRNNASFALAAPAVTHEDGTIQFAWLELDPNGQQILMSVANNANTWTTPETVLNSRARADTDNVTMMALGTETDGDANLVYRATNGSQTTRLMAAHCSRCNGNSRWQTPSAITPNTVGTSLMAGESFAFSVNAQGQHAVAWIGQVSDALNVYAMAYVARYQPGAGWSQAESVSTPVAISPVGGPPAGVMVAQVEHPHVMIDPAGEITTLWVENNVNSAELFATHYDTATGWNTPELIASYVSANNMIAQADVAVGQNNAHIVMWRQVMVDTVNNTSTHIIWTSEKSGSPGTVVTPPPPVTGDVLPPNHLATTTNCGACHATNGKVIVDHTEVIGACQSCHTQPATHLATTNMCEACHATTQWTPVIMVDHLQALGSCISCHNGTVATGKSANHIPSTDACDACHSHTTWVPVITVDHNQVLGTCGSCHNGIIARGKPRNHVVTQADCAQCHRTTNWQPFANGTTNGPLPTVQPANHINTSKLCTACHYTGNIRPVKVDHAQVIGACVDCHNGLVASGKSATHIATTDNCWGCHGTFAWVPATTVSHADVLGSCVACHNNVIGRGKPPNHILSTDLCEACHSIAAFLPIISLDHNQVIGSCYDCHNGVIASGKSASHIPSSNQCQLCHASTRWSPATTIPGQPPAPGQPPTPAPPPIASGWSNPINPITLSLRSTAMVHGPLLSATRNNSGMLTYVVHDKFDPVSGRFALSKTAAWKGSVDQNNWVPSLPAPENELFNATLIKTVRGGTNGDSVYALWSKGRSLFFNRYRTETGWGTAASIGHVDGDYSLVTQADGSAIAIWYEQLLPDSYVMNAAIYSATGSWSPVQSLQNNELMAFSPPVAGDNNSALIVGYQSFLNGGTSQIIAVIYQFTSANSWQVLGIGPDLNIPSLLDVSVQAIAARNNTGLIATVTTQNGPGPEQTRVFASVTQNTATWPAFVELGPIANNIDTVIGTPEVTANRNGDFMLVWAQTQSSNGGAGTHIVADFFSATNRQWQGVKRVANLPNRFDNEPSVVLRDNGEAVVAWVSSMGTSNSVISNSFTVQNGWSSSPSVAVMYDSNGQGQASSPHLSVSNSGAVELAWKQELFAGNNMVNMFWTSYKLP